MFPREHGAYGQLLFPIATAMAIGRPTAAALCLAAAAACAFLAHEPLLVLIGGRGVRAQREDRARAARWLSAFAALVVVLGVVAHLLVPALWKATLVPALLGAALLILVVAGLGRTVFAEALTAAALASIAYPVALLCGAASIAALTCAAVFAAGMASASVAVRAVIARTRNPPAIAARAGAAAFAVAANAGVIGLAHAGFATHEGGVIAHIFAVASIALAVVAPRAQHLRTVGWSLVAATLVTAVGLIAALR